MADPLKQFIKHMDGVNAAKQYDAAARAMAEHCDERIAVIRQFWDDKRGVFKMVSFHDAQKIRAALFGPERN